MSRYLLSPEAREDLYEIRDYLLREAGLGVSRQVIRDINAALRFLAVLPGAGHYRQDLTDAALRFWEVYSYPIIYDGTVRPIAVVRVLQAGTLPRCWSAGRDRFCPKLRGGPPTLALVELPR